LEKSCKLELLDFEHPEGEQSPFFFLNLDVGSEQYNVSGKKVFWHSSAHVLGESAERHYGCHLCLGPPTDEGFFYEMAIVDRSANLQPLARQNLTLFKTSNKRRLSSS